MSNRRLQSRLERIEIASGGYWNGFECGDPRRVWRDVYGERWKEIPLIDLLLVVDEYSHKERINKNIENGKTMLAVKHPRVRR